MKKLIFKVLLLLPFASLAQQVEMVQFPYVGSLIKNNSDTTYVINFWATWCKPCVKELPEFEKLNAEYADKKLKVILISLDFKRQFETRLIPYVKEKQLKSTVVLLNDPDYNSWIDKVDSSWGGAIPATLVVNNKMNIKKFYEKEFTFEELEKIIKPLIN